LCEGGSGDRKRIRSGSGAAQKRSRTPRGQSHLRVGPQRRRRNLMAPRFLTRPRPNLQQRLRLRTPLEVRMLRMRMRTTTGGKWTLHTLVETVSEAAQPTGTRPEIIKLPEKGKSPSRPLAPPSVLKAPVSPVPKSTSLRKTDQAIQYPQSRLLIRRR
jgi:hypothetical protein